MLLFLLLFFVVILWHSSIITHGYRENFISKNSTDSIKGIFIMVVFINHIKGYYEQAGADISMWYDSLFFLPAKAFGQLMVVMFLFYSGYGVMEGIKNKGQAYFDMIPKKRVLGTLVNFDVAVIVFAIAMLLIGEHVSWMRFLLSLIGWDAVGNSNWYIFVILACYAFTFVGQKVCAPKGTALTCILIVVFAFVLSLYKGTWWYNTMFAYGAGLIFSEHKDDLILSMRNHYLMWIICIGACFILCLSTYLYFYGPFKGEMQRLGALVFDVMSVFFALLVVLCSMKVHIGNKILMWLGANLFPLYIYQRLPMMVLTDLYPDVIVAQHPYVFLLMCITITCSIAWGYKLINIKIT